MNKDLQKRWVDALRSGQYEQGRGALNQSGRYCCLGVLCDLYSKDTGVPWMASTIDRSHLTMEGHQSILPSQVTEWCGMDARFGGLLVDMNDNQYMTFDEIAEFIEKNVD